MKDKRRAFVDAERRATDFITAWRNDAPYKSRMETSPSLNSQNKKCRSLAENVNTESDAPRAWCICFVPRNRNTWSSFTEKLVLNFSEVLRWLFSVNMATIALFEATVAA